jgi:hypothetical protein
MSYVNRGAGDDDDGGNGLGTWMACPQSANSCAPPPASGWPGHRSTAPPATSSRRAGCSSSRPVWLRSARRSHDVGV